MGVQHLVVIGCPILCGTCREVAAVTIRQENRDGTYDVLTYCDICWLEIRRGYGPLTAHDAAAAIASFDDPDSHAQMIEVTP